MSSGWLIWYGLASAATIPVYAWDKRCARLGRRRVRERTLHAFELLGGWPGAILARQALRHKTRDTRFLLVSWLIIAAHLAAWGLWWWWGGR
jgi:uncharacterized membrane protein YsdA (DUF1294 family)